MLSLRKILRIAPVLLLAVSLFLVPRGPVQATAAEDRAGAELTAFWNDLASRESAKGYRAIWGLVGAGDRAVEFLKERLRPAGVGSKIRELIADLDDKRFAVREAASLELNKLGRAVTPALREVLAKTPSAEVRRRATALLAQLNQVTPLAASTEELQMVRGVQVLEYIGTSRAREVLRALAGGAPGARATEEARAALQRLSRPSEAP
jgi:hypothetical protein